MPTEEAAPLSAEDQPFFDAIKQEFGDKCCNDLAIRAARAFAHKKNRLQTTLDETRAVLAWREKLQVDSILTRELDQSKIYFECWPGLMYGEDNEGHLIAIDRISEISMEGFLANFQHVDALLPHRAQYMERIQWEKAAISRRLGRRVYKHICIVDLRGLGMKHVSRSMLNHLKVRDTLYGAGKCLGSGFNCFLLDAQPIFDVGQHYYPETLHRLYLVNAPMIFYGAWKVIATLIDPDTREKIQVFVRWRIKWTVVWYQMLILMLEQKDNQGFLDAAQKHGIPLSSLPSYLGGTHHGRPMNSTFRPSVADTPLPVAPAFSIPVEVVAAGSEVASPAEEQPIPVSPISADSQPS